MSAFQFPWDLVTEWLEGLLNRGVRMLQAEMLVKTCCGCELTATYRAAELCLRQVGTCQVGLWCIRIGLSVLAVTKGEPQLLHDCTGMCLRFEFLFAVVTG